MLALKRLLLIVFVLATPPVLTILLYHGTNALLAATNRVIDPQIVQGAAVAEFFIFLLIAFLEAKNRWSA
ncbi:MAG TPA: hypothetical protein VHW02_00395 [Rhizomicrobium sp.]|jgi:hypothetical protein|nr:hypothetical protein [Rhizomicrobium sp.]